MNDTNKTSEIRNRSRSRRIRTSRIENKHQNSEQTVDETKQNMNIFQERKRVYVCVCVVVSDYPELQELEMFGTRRELNDTHKKQVKIRNRTG